MRAFVLYIMMLMLGVLSSSLAVASFGAFGQPQGGAISCQNPQSDFACMACSCFNEAGREPYAGQVAVGLVVMTRMTQPQFPNSVCGNIKKYKAFSWWDLYQRRSVPVGHSCRQAAQASLTFRGCFSNHYHAGYVRPYWLRGRMRFQQRIKNHLFYSDASCGNYPVAYGGQAPSSQSLASLLAYPRMPQPVATPMLASAAAPTVQASSNSTFREPPVRQIVTDSEGRTFQTFSSAPTIEF